MAIVVRECRTFESRWTLMVNCCPKSAETLVISDQSYPSIGYSIAVGSVQKNAQLCTANSVEQLGKIQERGFAGCAGIGSPSCTARSVQTARSPDAEIHSNPRSPSCAKRTARVSRMPARHFIYSRWLTAGCFGKMSYRTYRETHTQ